MKKLALLGLSILALSVGGMAQLQNVNKVAEERDATIIVKLKGDVSNVSYKSVLNRQNAVLNEISSTITTNYRVINRFSHALNGFVLKVPSAYVSSIRYMDAVDKVNYNNIIPGSAFFDDGINYEIKVNANSTASSKTMEKPEGTNDGHGTFIAILDNGFYIKTNEDSTQEYHHVFAPLEEEDAIITQESLRTKIDAADKFNGKYDDDHSTYYNNKVPFYYDYGGDTSGVVKPDFDVYAEGQDHGTHVASIAGGNAGAEYQGIAPKAQMALMKVFTTYLSGQKYQSGAYPAAVLAALEDCLVLDVDSINMSLGSNLNDFDDTEIVEDVIRQLEAKGTFVNVAAGNSGKAQYSNYANKYWEKNMVESNIISSYANNMAAMTVASAQADEQFYGEAFTVDGVNIQFEDQVVNYNSTSGPVEYDPERHLMDLYTDGGENEFDFFYTGDDGIGEEKEYTGVDMTGKVAIVNRGSINFSQKVKTAVKLGAIAIGIINNEGGNDFNIRMAFSSGSEPFYSPEIPVIFILQKDQAAFSKSTTHKLKLIKNTDLENPNKRQISDYSSDGMRYDLSIKPEISTPGENIKGAVLGDVGKYESMSGTSMATPNYTGAVALMISNHLGDNDYRRTINSRLMSTAQPMKDATEDNNYVSVRRQGAGLVNLDAAINSKIYLEGIDPNGRGLGKAKIELFNNDDIKHGNLNLSFKAINEGDAAASYTAKTYVLAPKLAEYNEELYPEFAGQKFQTTQEQLVEVFTDSINIPANGETPINIQHSIASDKLAALDADFDNGCLLEGFVILEANGSFKQLSIPFLGYYGELANQSPVEPFDFEREDGKIYNSDILNNFITQQIVKNESLGYDYTKADYTSRIVAGYWSETSKVSVSNPLVYNTSGITRINDENNDMVKSVGMNPYTGEYDPDALFVGNNGSTNTMIIQQYVNRSVRDNVLTLTNKATNEVVLEDHMFDNIMGSQVDSVTGEKTYPLYKSHFDDSLIDNGYMAHRAYSIIGLYSKDIDTGKHVNYPDGEYEMKFTYELSAGSTYVVTYTLTIESEIPTLMDVKPVKVDGQDYYRFYYNDANLSYVKVNDKPYPVSKDENGKLYADVPADKFGDSNVALVNAIDSAYGQEKYIAHIDDENFIIASHKIFITGYDFAYAVEGEGTNNQKFTFSFSKNGKAVTSLSGAVSYRMSVPDGLDIETLKVYTVDARGREKEITFVRNGDLIEFSNTIKIFAFKSDPVLSGISISGPTTTAYNIGDTFDPAGLEVTANYSDGSSKVLAANEYDISSVDMSTAGEKTVTITYEGKIATFEILVNDNSHHGGGDNSSSEPISSSEGPISSSEAPVSSSEAPISSSTAPTPTSSEQPVASSEPAPASEQSGSNEEGGKSSGCGGVVASGSVMALVAALGLAFVSLKKKRIK